ncbi:MAG: ComEC/Rec2 family competence protein [Candidatus Jorgensenbacteria bacterium]
MRSYDVFFFGALFFLLGVLLASMGVKAGTLWIFLALEVGCLAAWAFFERIPSRFRWRIARKGWLALIALLFLLPVGALYYTWDDRDFRAARFPSGEVGFSGVVVGDPKGSGTTQEAVVELSTPHAGKVLVKLRSFPRVAYGDTLALTGTVEPPSPASYARYLAKERVGCIVAFPVFSVVASGNGSPVRAFLYEVKHRVIGAFQRALPVEEAAFLGGLTVGERSEFSREFRDAMQRSGTTHLVALSGYNISIVAWVAMGFFITFLRRRWAFAATVLVILGFVLMTGGEASVVRAAIMGVLLLIAREVGRVYSIRNAVLFAALAMVLVNPKVLAFDVGFQLSFLAFLGIAYLRPAIVSLLRFPEEPGFLSWRDNLTATASAQLAVVPLLISSFGGFSVFSLVANVIVLELVPVTMGLGFLMAFLTAAGEYAALAFGWLTWVLLRFEVAVIKFFGVLYIPLAPELNWFLITFYYAALVGFIIYVRRHTLARRTA